MSVLAHSPSRRNVTSKLPALHIRNLKYLNEFTVVAYFKNVHYDRNLRL